ncbi:MAG: group III truncated hemoglobin [Pseudobdellovibrio sp.]
MEIKLIPKAEEQIIVNGVAFKHGDMNKVVDDFYFRIQNDPALKIPFQSVHDWPEHIQRLTHFWWIRFGGKPYLFSEYNPVAKHFFAGFNDQLLKKWLALFHETLKANMQKEQVELWTRISTRIGESLTIKNEMYRHDYENRNN